VRRTASLAVRRRYFLLVAVALGSTVYGVWFDPERYFSDWLIFEVGARTLTHYHHLVIYNGAPLHLYANDPMIQIGPPPLLMVVATQWLPPHVVSGIWVGLMTLMGVAALGFIEAAAHRLRGSEPATGIRVAVLVGGAPLLAAWGYYSAKFHHLDDALALLMTALAVWLCATRRSGWAIGIALGVAAASKPWAVVLVPILMGIPRSERPKAVLGFVVTAVAFWAPFIVAAPETIHALGLYRILPQPGSILRLAGMTGHVEGWLRPVQFALGVAAASYVGLRRSWTSAPLVGLAVRVGLDPYVYAYYGLGPVLAALLWDLTRPTSRRLPLWTLWTLLVEFGLRLVGPPTLGAVGRVIWVLSVLVGVMLSRRRPPEPDAVTAEHPAAAGQVPVTA
jgi:hypothetical protein